MIHERCPENQYKVIPGNINPYLESKHDLDPPLWASKVRFYPYSHHARMVCMRVELYGCRWTDGIVSYSMPQGDKRGPNRQFYDFGYDGVWDGPELKHGLGQLIDGKFGHDDFKNDVDEQIWVGWKNDSRHKPVEIKFEFDRVREFSSVNIFSNNKFTKDVQVFSIAKVAFSIGGKRFNKGEPITFEYVEDKIFENARNITIKLHHRVGKYVKIQLFFASKWILISEISFESVVAHGNFTVEPEPTTTMVPIVDHEQKIEIPVPRDVNEPTIIVIITVSVIVIVAAIVFLVYKFKNRKYMRSPKSSNLGFPNGSLPHHFQGNDSVYSMPEKDHIEAYGVTEINDCSDEYYRKSHGGGSVKSSLRSTLPLPHPEENTYQEPYQAMKFAPYYSYSPVIMEIADYHSSSPKKSTSNCDNYDYAIPEGNTIPLLSGCEQNTLPITRSNRVNSASKNLQRSSVKSTTKSCGSQETERSPTQQEALAVLQKRLEETTIQEFPRHRLRMLSKLSEGTFGTVYIAETDGISDYSSPLDTKLVAIKFLSDNASEKEKRDFFRDVRILSALDDENIARVLGICSKDEPLCVVMEYLEHGDLCQFLKMHVTTQENNTTLPYGVKSLSFNCLLYIATQIAGGMRYLETLHFVHRDLATRNCLIGKAYKVKICDYGTYNELYVNDYYKVDGNTPVPIRWMSWEAVYQLKYTTKSDVWSFAVTLWEILTLCRRQPFDFMTNPDVMENLARLHCNDNQFQYLPKSSINKELYELMLECWKREEKERPTFSEIHMFLQRKNLGYGSV
ncbi:hypothetical protein ABEB36_001070 [Hypothenemus hampei]|uniref:Uncharacterized protein n=1 Tax=Hypothenemus hampei TaxID=57062 RepID=A0ABD1FDD6_HYPHA